MEIPNAIIVIISNIFSFFIYINSYHFITIFTKIIIAEMRQLEKKNITKVR